MNKQAALHPDGTGRSTMYGESGFARREADAYFTEPWVTACLAGRVSFRGRVWEPACGRGDMSKALQAQSYDVFSTDVRDWGADVQYLKDFLTHLEVPAGCESIVTNPPYDAAESFIQHALNLTEPVQGMVAMLLRNEFDCARGHRRFFHDHPAFACRLTLTKRPRWAWWETDRKDKAAPRHNFMWAIWDWQNRGMPTVRYAP